MKPLVLVTLFLVLSLRGVATEHAYGSGYEPEPPVPFPLAYKDYQILPGTISPDRRYAFIYPKRSLLYELQTYGLFLAALNPFCILSRVPTGHSNLAENARNYYAASWAKDTSMTVFVAGSKWGPEKVWVLQLHDGKVAKQSDLTAAVRQQVRPDYEKSHAARYNEYYEFIFEGELESTDGWRLDRGQVIIETTCTTDPKELDVHRWAVRFKGAWDVAEGRFTEKSFVRIPSEPN